jgi:chloramphenicol-sensitive protein RarD
LSGVGEHATPAIPRPPETRPPETRPIERRLGVPAGVGAYLLWGLFPLYWPLLEPAGPVEILAHRVVWSLALVLGLLALRGGFGRVRDLVRRPRALGGLAAAAAVVAVNWGTYIYGVNSGHVVETSLGYFINPLVTVVLGVVVLGERLRPGQWGAVALATAAVAVLTLDYGHPPWIALTLALSFGLYGLTKKTVGAGAVEGLAVETALLFLPALGYLLFLQAAGTGTFGAAGAAQNALLLASGVVTAVPLLLFGAAATRIPLTTLGLLQYLAPVLQFLFGVLVFHEAMPPARLAGFGLVWLALVVFSLDGLRERSRVRGARRADAVAEVT